MQIDASNRSCWKHAEFADNAIELSQTRQAKWVDADVRAKCQFLEVTCLSCLPDGVILVLEWSKPVDVLAEGIVSEYSQDDRTR